MNALTIDVEDWYHCLEPDPAQWHRFEDRITGAVRRTLDVLEPSGTKATFFVLGHVADRHPELVAELHALGHEIASHGQEHRFVYQQTPAEFESDVSRNVSTLSAIIGAPVRGYRAPCFSITRQSLWALPILKKLGMAYDSSIFPVVNHRYGIPDAPRFAYDALEGLREWPVSTFRLAGINLPFAGGAYFRLLPYALVRGMFKRLNDRGEPVMFYLHPWELDPGHPRIPLPVALRFRHYHGLAKTAGRLGRLIDEFPFSTVRAILNQ